MSDNIAGALELLERAKQTHLAEAAAIDKAIRDLQGSLTATAQGHIPVSNEYMGLGIVDATKRYLAEVGEGQTTSQIAEALLARGIQTNSKNFTATVHATIIKSGAVKRNRKLGVWELA